MHNRLILTILLLLAVILALGCGRSDSVSTAQPSPSPTPESPADLETEFQLSDDTPWDFRREARQAASDFVKAKLPDWQIRGLSSRQYSGNIFWVDIDLQKGKDNAVVGVVVRKFFPESGDPYWKAVPLRVPLEDQLRELPQADILRRFDRLDTNLRELRHPTKGNDQ